MTQLYNGLGAVLALVCASLAGINWTPPDKHVAVIEAGTDQQPITTVLPNGERALIDATGQAVSLRAFQRIASASTVADGVLLELVERERLVGFTAYSINQGWQRHRYAGVTPINSINEVEAIISLKPDLVLASLHGSEQQVARLREAGIIVFNLGEMRGVAGFIADVRAIATLLQVPERGEQYVTTFTRRLNRIASPLPQTERKTVAYVAVFGNKLYGSGRNTNYADVFRYAGLIDKGAEKYQDFPEYSAEQVLQLDPQLIVSRDNTQGALCTLPGLQTLHACRDPRRFILELPEAVISSAGAEMLLAAEAVHDFAYGAER